MRSGFTYENIMKDLSIEQVLLYTSNTTTLQQVDDKSFVYKILLGSRGDNEAVDKFFKEKVN